MQSARTIIALEPLAAQVNACGGSLEGMTNAPLFGSWEKRTDQLTDRNNEALRTLPDGVRVSTDIAKQCVMDQIRYLAKVHQIEHPSGIPKDLLRVADVIITGHTAPHHLPAKLVTTFMGMLREDDERIKKHQQSVEERHEVLGPILAVYALCEDNEGYFLRKSTWKTRSENIYASQDSYTEYRSVPDSTGIDKSVNVEKLMSNEREKG